MKWMFGVLCLLVAVTASGQSIFKCRDAKGGLVYQSDPCPNAEKRWDVQPGAKYGSYSQDDRMSAAAAEHRIDATRHDVRVANSRRAPSAAIGGGVSTGRSGAIIGPNQSYGCRSARAGAESARKAAGVHLTFRGASALDRSVANACK